MTAIEVLPVPADFDAYWAEVREEVAGLPLRTEVSDWSPGGAAWLAGVRAQRVDLVSVGGQRVGGILQLPDDPDSRAPGGGGRLPGLLHCAGYGGELLLHQDLVAAGFAVFDFSHRGMELGLDGFDRRHPRPLLARDVEDRQRYVFRHIYQDCLLALRYLRQHPLIDADRIGVLGTSQGGGLTIGLAAEGGVRAAAADLPWMTHFALALARPVQGSYNEVKDLLREHPELEERVRSTLAYYDTTSFATRVQVPTLVALGQADSGCVPESIRPMFERLGGCKMLLEVPGLTHHRSRLFRRVAADWLRTWI